MLLTLNGGAYIVKRESIVDKKEIKDAMNLAKARVHHYLSTGWSEMFTKQDLESAAFEGISEAIQRFEPKKGSVQDTKFTSYAHFWIDKYILEYITKNKTLLSGSLASHWRGDVAYTYSLDATTEDGPKQDCSFNAMDFNPDASADYMMLSDQKDITLKSIVSNAIMNLPNDQKIIVQLHFGIDTINNETFEIGEIAKELGLTKGQVTEKLTSALSFMNENCEALRSLYSSTVN